MSIFSSVKLKVVVPFWLVSFRPLFFVSFVSVFGTAFMFTSRLVVLLLHVCMVGLANFIWKTYQAGWLAASDAACVKRRTGVVLEWEPNLLPNAIFLNFTGAHGYRLS